MEESSVAKRVISSPTSENKSFPAIRRYTSELSRRWKERIKSGIFLYGFSAPSDRKTVLSLEIPSSSRASDLLQLLGYVSMKFPWGITTN
jgi:hypothetical protein